MLTSFEIAKEAQRLLHKASGDIAWSRSATFYFHWRGVEPMFVIQFSEYNSVFWFHEGDLGLTLDQFGKRYLRPVAIVLDDRRAKAAA